jgi:predicted lipid carrier protein YhbT
VSNNLLAANGANQREAVRFFEYHLPRLVGALLLDDYVSLTTRFNVVLVDVKNQLYRLAIVDGRLTHADGAGGQPAVTYRLDAATLIDVVAGTSTPQDAFFEMRIDIDGDMETGLELGAVFADFFRFHPYRPSGEGA